MMKILTLNNEFPPVGAGASVMSYQLSRELVRRSHCVDVMTAGYKNLDVEQYREGITIYRQASNRKYLFQCNIFEIINYITAALNPCQQLIRRKKYDVIHCHSIVPAGLLGYLLNKRMGIPYVITAHGTDVPGYNPSQFRWIHKFSRPWLRLICRHAQKIISPSHYLAGLIRTHIGTYPMVHIPNAVDIDPFGHNDDVTKENIILATGRLVEWKGFHTLIRAVHNIQLPYEIHVVGDGPCRSTLEAMAANAQTPIIFHGWLSNDSPVYHRLYKKASIYVLMSSGENASISLLEAMAAKCAVITTSTGGGPEMVGHAGIFVDYNNDCMLRDKLMALIHRPKLMMYYGNQAFQRVRQRFTWQTISDQYLHAFQSNGNVNH